MTKKNFTAIAEAVAAEKALAEKSMNGAARLDTLYSTAQRMAEICQGFNRNFDRTRFLTACGF